MANELRTRNGIPYDFVDGLRVRGVEITTVSTTPPLNETVGAAASVGSSVSAARSDHVHAMPALVTAVLDGFMSKEDKAKLDAVEAGAQANTVTSVAGKTAAVLLEVSDVDGAAPLDSPALTGAPTAPTAAVGTNTGQVATTEFARSAVGELAPTKTGTNATGTWGIDITGTASHATTAGSVSAIDDPGSSKTVIGYAVIPGSGIIIQWGVVTNSATPGNSTLVTFPIEFPTAAASVTVSILSDTLMAAVCWYGSLSKTSFLAYSDTASAVSTWIAVGY